MSTFTAGPWDVNHFGGEWRVIARTQPHEVAICTTSPEGADPIATARLIAAAPQLLEALERVLANACPLTGNPSPQQLVAYWEDEKSAGRGEAGDMLFALAAIAAATGAP